MAHISKATSAFKFSQVESASISKGTALFILSNLGALRLKERSVLVGLIAELCKYIAQSERLDFTEPPIKPSGPHLGNPERYSEEKLRSLAAGTHPFDDDFVSKAVATAELVERGLSWRR